MPPPLSQAAAQRFSVEKLPARSKNVISIGSNVSKYEMLLPLFRGGSGKEQLDLYLRRIWPILSAASTVELNHDGAEVAPALRYHCATSSGQARDGPHSTWGWGRQRGNRALSLDAAGDYGRRGSRRCTGVVLPPELYCWWAGKSILIQKRDGLRVHATWTRELTSVMRGSRCIRGPGGNTSDPGAVRRDAVPQLQTKIEAVAVRRHRRKHQAPLPVGLYDPINCRGFVKTRRIYPSRAKAQNVYLTFDIEVVVADRHGWPWLCPGRTATTLSSSTYHCKIANDAPHQRDAEASEGLDPTSSCDGHSRTRLEIQLPGSLPPHSWDVLACCALSAERRVSGAARGRGTRHLHFVCAIVPTVVARIGMRPIVVLPYGRVICIRYVAQVSSVVLSHGRAPSQGSNVPEKTQAILSAWPVAQKLLQGSREVVRVRRYAEVHSPPRAWSRRSVGRAGCKKRGETGGDAHGVSCSRSGRIPSSAMIPRRRACDRGGARASGVRCTATSASLPGIGVRGLSRGICGVHEVQRSWGRRCPWCSRGWADVWGGRVGCTSVGQGIAAAGQIFRRGHVRDNGDCDSMYWRRALHSRGPCARNRCGHSRTDVKVLRVCAQEAAEPGEPDRAVSAHLWLSCATSMRGEMSLQRAEWVASSVGVERRRVPPLWPKCAGKCADPRADRSGRTRGAATGWGFLQMLRICTTERQGLSVAGLLGILTSELGRMFSRELLVGSALIFDSDSFKLYLNDYIPESIGSNYPLDIVNITGPFTATIDDEGNLDTQMGRSISNFMRV
ncbi:hypothetical protein C8R47DRAFT_1084769 [Mycena vitilis]|nr:hypothetical protein C8R47DRAFT_1264573 [Mycena vitilis]KAJ6449313.1 hypothetical protein C8R47DRAFT_1084769 [Mycena vitilis]